jgi:hypothetical protein
MCVARCTRAHGCVEVISGVKKGGKVGAYDWNKSKNG